jgi:hypothetical protein
VADEATLCREMGCTRDEFLAWLPAAVQGARFEVDGDLIRIGYAGGEVLIRMAQAAERRLGLLSLPVLPVSIRFDGIDAERREEFLRHFDLRMRRGGG